MGINQPGSIYRNNLMVRTNVTGSVFAFGLYSYSGYPPGALNNRIYNNVVYRSGGGALEFLNDQGYATTGNVLMNNIFYNDNNGVPAGDYSPMGLYDGAARQGDLWNWAVNPGLFKYNLWANPGLGPLALFANTPPTLNLTQIQAQFSSAFSNNISVNPGFVAPDSENFTLSPTSPAIDAGSFLTYTSSIGTNTTSVPVTDATFFTDGMGIVTGDVIQIGANPPSQIVQITGNTLTISSPASFANGTPVSFPFLGKSPDMGAFESY